MAHVKLIFEDQEDGGIAFRAVYAGGEDPHSNAHKLANQVIHFLDEQAAGKTQEEIRHAGDRLIQ